MPKREYGEIGKHAGFKILCRMASRFKSEYSHHLIFASLFICIASDNLEIAIKAAIGDICIVDII